ncbi:hypothetical protein [Kutzneria albida]|uniref:Uncharacterized protein n=1 Tax=Kutzneria albida DSM 43870 TaxID=1449976 RepID=W5W0S3_9PSEU|nr:hypothetical protein [Kutzneria albida]AHH94768.1 hypothetical protein KALB_1395 [Kutzneria albida DSM 43870]
MKEFQAKPVHLLFGLLAVVCAVISASSVEDTPLRVGWITIGLAGLVWLGFVGAALRRQRRRRSST